MNDNVPTLALCMIVRDEAALLPDCLASVAELVHEMLVVDTGSTDATARIAADFGARVIPFSWNNHFADARNVSIRDAQCDWILWLDADERLRPEEHDRVRKAVRASAPYAYNVPILNQDRKNGHYSKGHRLFRNHLGIRFSGRVHEQVSPSFPKRKQPVPDADFTIDHLGYNLPEEALAEKQARNLRLLTLARAQDPRDAYVRFTLGQAHLIQGEFEAAEREIKAALGERRGVRMRKSLPADIQAAAQCNLANCALERGDRETALARCRASLQAWPEQAMAHLLAYRVHQAAGEPEQALRHLEKVETRLAPSLGSHKRSAIDATVNQSELWSAMGQLCLILNQTERAETYLRKVETEGPDRAPVLAALAKCAVAASQFEKAKSYAEKALKIRADDAGLREILSLASLQQGDFDGAATHLAAICRQHPDNEAARKRLIGVLVKAGRRAEAEEMLARASG
jgi:tetratricopeptide (TPR) repeat protein